MTSSVVSAIKEHISLAVKAELARAFPTTQQATGSGVQVHEAQSITSVGSYTVRTAASTWTPQNTNGGVSSPGLEQRQHNGELISAGIASGAGTNLGASELSPRELSGVGLGPIPAGSQVSGLPGTGESLGIEGSVPLSAPLPLDFAVNKDTRENIWANEYVELACCLIPLK